MKSYVTVLALFLVSLPCTALATQFANEQAMGDGPPPVPPSGSQFFRALFDYAGFQSNTSKDPFVKNLNKRVVVVFGLPKNEFEIRVIQNLTRNTIASGGAVVFATDQRISLNGYVPIGSPYLNISGFVASSSKANDAYNNLPFCPYASIGEHDKAITPQVNPFAGVSRIATNRPSLVFEPNDNRLSVYARLVGPLNLTYDGKPAKANPPANAFAVGQILPERLNGGRWLAMADESCLANDLFAAPGTENFLFALHLVGWLQEGGRNECTFFEYGRVVDRLDEVKFVTSPDMPLPPLPGIPPQATIVKEVNRALDQAQEQDFFHKVIVGDTPERFAQGLRVLGFLAGLYAFWYLMKRAFASKQPTSEPIGDPEFSGAAGGTLLAALKREVVRSNDFSDAVVEYLRDTFTVAGLPEGTVSRELPPVVVLGAKVNRKTLMKDLKQLWQLAYGPQTEPVHYAVWKGLEPMIDRVRRLAEKGRWRFEPTGGSA